MYQLNVNATWSRGYELGLGLFRAVLGNYLLFINDTVRIRSARVNRGLFHQSFDGTYNYMYIQLYYVRVSETRDLQWTISDLNSNSFSLP